MTRARPATAPRELAIEVDDPLGTGVLTQAGWLFCPERPAQAPAVLVCFAGACYSKAYWHLDVPGRPGYSFAADLAARGFVVIALDHLGTGGSSRPVDADRLRLDTLAAGDAAAARRLRTMLAEGTLSAELPAMQPPPLLGVGHSMGGSVVAVAQAESEAFDAVALLGCGVGVDVPPATDGGAAGATSPELVVRALAGSSWADGYLRLRREQLRELFYLPDVPAEVIAADEAGADTTPRWCVVEAVTPGRLATATNRIAVPVLLAFGERDVVPEPEGERAHFAACPDLTLTVLAGSAHCHNVSAARVTLWDRLDRWARRVTASR